jgi:hypothetical protein
MLDGDFAKWDTGYFIKIAFSHSATLGVLVFIAMIGSCVGTLNVAFSVSLRMIQLISSRGLFFLIFRKEHNQCQWFPSSWQATRQLLDNLPAASLFIVVAMCICFVETFETVLQFDNVFVLLRLLFQCAFLIWIKLHDNTSVSHVSIPFGIYGGLIVAFFLVLTSIVNLMYVEKYVLTVSSLIILFIVSSYPFFAMGWLNRFGFSNKRHMYRSLRPSESERIEKMDRTRSTFSGSPS